MPTPAGKSLAVQAYLTVSIPPSHVVVPISLSQVMILRSKTLPSAKEPQELQPQSEPGPLQKAAVAR